MTLNNKNIREAVATAAATSSLWGPKALGAIMTGVGAVGTYLQSKKKKAKEKEDLLGAVRKKQDEIQQDVANKETLEKNKDFQKKEKSRGKYLPRIREPENKFVGEGASIALNVGSKIPWGKVITGLAGAYGTIYQMDKRNKPGSGTKEGGVWDSLPSHTGKKELDPVDQYTSKDVIRMRKNRAKAKEEKELKRKEANKEKLKRTIEDLYGPIPEHVNWREELKG
tara:strand:+ start:59 stop:733 length:675 start_codon:yes stop_codon:yes gene_type:complete